ncbi:MAG TPA: DHA2 family efflux MFS transporter permease subunit [Candidatus Udaeobacter sp.]|nr:DHA2 family efflux MFS transporter permease subunit [Candidatus Udaeobacter sp.]
MQTAEPVAPAKSHVPPTRWIVAPVVAMAAFMEILDISIANVSLQHIAGSMGASQDEATWVLTSYLITNAIILPISGWLSAVLGRKRFYLVCILGFGVSSFFCGLAPSLGLLILFRAIQGLTGGGLQPSSQAILADSFKPAERGMAFAFYGIAVVFAPAIGPTLGGWITDNYSWHWVFLINVPISIGLYFLISAMIEDPPHLVEERQRLKERGVKIDYWGFGFLVLGLGSLQYVLDRGQEDDWFGSNAIILSMIGAVAGLLCFVLWELRQQDPLTDLRLLKNRNFAMSNILMFMLGFVLLGSTQLIPQFVQTLLGYTATDAGLVVSPGGFAIILLMPVIGRLVSRVDSRFLIVFGLALSAAALYHMTSFDLQVDYWTVALARIVQACGLAFLFIPISTIAYVGIPREKNNNASAIINLSRNLGGSVGIALLTTSLARRSQYHQSILVERVAAGDPRYAAMAAKLQQHMASLGGTADQARHLAQAEIGAMLGRQAAMLSYVDDFLMLAIAFAALIPFVFLARQPGHGQGPGAGAH